MLMFLAASAELRDENLTVITVYLLDKSLSLDPSCRLCIHEDFSFLPLLKKKAGLC
jgi:hypothetical protein